MQSLNSIKFKPNMSDKTLGSSRLEFNLKGENIDYVVVNTIRRIAMSNIPVYSFQDFKFNKNSTVFNNNIIKSRLKNMVVWGIKNDHKTLIGKDMSEKEEDIEEELNEEIGLTSKDVVDLPEVAVDDSSLEQMTLYLDFKNDTYNIVTATTDDCQFYFNGSVVKSPYPNPIPIVKLQPEQEINVTAITKLGEENISAHYSAVNIFTYREISDHDYDIILESRGQHTEKTIFSLACHNIIKHLELLKEMIPKVDSTKMDGEIIIDNYSNTFGNLISHGMILHKDVKYATYYMKHPMDNEVYIRYELIKNNIVTVLTDVITFYQKLFSKMEKMV